MKNIHEVFDVMLVVSFRKVQQKLICYDVELNFQRKFINNIQFLFDFWILFAIPASFIYSRTDLLIYQKYLNVLLVCLQTISSEIRLLCIDNKFFQLTGNNCHKAPTVCKPASEAVLFPNRVGITFFVKYNIYDISFISTTFSHLIYTSPTQERTFFIYYLVCFE